jgi:hypothetical protein
LRNGRKTPLDEVDHRGEQLLSKYSDPSDRGRIYYQLAHIHAQSGLLHPEQVIAYAKKALQCPLETSQRTRLHIYWGDALHVLDRKKPFASRRRESADVYLKRLREIIALKLPEKAPEPELMTMFNGPDAKENRRKMEEQWARRQKIDFLREMIMHRKVLQGQVVAMYGRRPVATEELRSMATGILGEGKELDRLMAAVGDRVAKLPPETKPKMIPIPVAAAASAPAESSTYLYLGIALGVGAVIAVALLLLSRRRRAPQEGAPGASQ